MAISPTRAYHPHGHIPLTHPTFSLISVSRTLWVLRLFLELATLFSLCTRPDSVLDGRNIIHFESFPKSRRIYSPQLREEDRARNEDSGVRGRVRTMSSVVGSYTTRKCRVMVERYIAICYTLQITRVHEQFFRQAASPPPNLNFRYCFLCCAFFHYLYYI